MGAIVVVVGAALVIGAAVVVAGKAVVDEPQAASSAPTVKTTELPTRVPSLRYPPEEIAI
jgi:hypothetical protein